MVFLGVGMVPGAARRSIITPAQFVTGMSSILGANQRVLYTPNGTDTTTSVESSSVGRTITWDGDSAARRSRLGNGFVQSFNGTSQYGEAPDTDDLSFGNGTVDSAFSILAFVNISAITGEHVILAKWNSGAEEWRLVVDSSGLIRFYLQDASVGVSPTARTAANGIVAGTWTLVGATYTAATGGATAADDMSVYAQGIDRTASRTSAGTYVAMENTVTVLSLATRNVHSGVFFPGSMGMVALTQKAMTAAEHLAARSLCSQVFGA